MEDSRRPVATATAWLRGSNRSPVQFLVQRVSHCTTEEKQTRANGFPSWRCTCGGKSPRNRSAVPSVCPKTCWVGGQNRQFRIRRTIGAPSNGRNVQEVHDKRFTGNQSNTCCPTEHTFDKRLPTSVHRTRMRSRGLISRLLRLCPTVTAKGSTASAGPMQCERWERNGVPAAAKSIIVCRTGGARVH